VRQLELLSVDLPFRHPFRHSAAARSSSESLLVKCLTDTGAIGFGESLPRAYVTGETRDDAFALLETSILPRLIGMDFDSLDAVQRFLATCDGKAPPEWVASCVPQSAAWCAVDLALLDAFGRAFGQQVRLSEKGAKGDPVHYAAVVSAGAGWRYALSLLKLKLYGFKQVKLKVNQHGVLGSARVARRVMGNTCHVRVDANMAWGVSEALEHIRALERVGIRCVEQPLDAADLEGLAMLVRETQAEIIADESFSDHASLERLLDRRACSGINVRISKCGGLVAAARRCEESLRTGLTVQIGCQVGESSLLSAAQLILISAVRSAKYLEGCYGNHLLRDDPARPCLQLGYGGRAPQVPEGFGLGVTMDEVQLDRWVNKRVLIATRDAKQMKGDSYVTAA
jgi:muconate cycloisomerase